MPQLIISALLALLLGVWGVIKWSGRSYMKAPLTITIALLTVSSVALFYLPEILKHDWSRNQWTNIVAIVFLSLTAVAQIIATVFLVKMVNRFRFGPKERDDFMIFLEKELHRSTHLMDYYAPEKDFTNPETKQVDHRARAREVKNNIVLIERDEKKKVPQHRVRFAIHTNRTKFERVLADAQQELGIDEIRFDPSFTAGGYHQVIMVGDKSVNPLTEKTLFAHEFYSTLPMCERNWANIPVGLNEDLDVVYLPMTHTLIAGTSGSGKGSVIQAILQFYLTVPDGEESFFDQGLVKFYGIDPKYNELKQFMNASFLETVVDPETGREWKTATDPDEQAITINQFHERMEQRIKYSASRSFTPTKQTPLLILIIDELLDASGTFSKDTVQQLRSVMVKGRSVGMFVVGAVQEVIKERLPHRDNFTNKVALRLSKQADASTLFGQDASTLADQGVKPEEFINPSSANNYYGAGLAYMFNGDSNTFELMRFFYTTEEDLERIKLEYTPEEYLQDMLSTLDPDVVL